MPAMNAAKNENQNLDFRSVNVNKEVANSNKRRADPSFQNSEIMKPTPKINVTREIAESIGVSTDTVSRVRQIEQHATRTTDDAYMGEPYLVVRCPFCHEVRIPDEEVTEELREFFAL